MRIEYFVDDEREPRGSFDAPGTFEIDTTTLADGPHTLVVRAQQPGGAPGVERIPFIVRNGPGIAIFGIRENETLRGRVPILVNAYASRIGDEFEPARAETPSPIPTWAFVLSLVVAAWALYYAAAEYRGHASALAATAPTQTQSAAAAAPAQAKAAGDALGDQVFGNYCAACHQLDGAGLPGVFPPLRGDPVVNSPDAKQHIETILAGRSGVPVGGVTYGAAMPPFGPSLTDDEIAAVVNHERASWGNSAPPVTPSFVAGVRSAH
ncbi:MAG TPA: cytochrome c [Myxococcota bacterium]|nr:cytochrome c [Myxococcota bacterium]